MIARHFNGYRIELRDEPVYRPTNTYAATIYAEGAQEGASSMHGIKVLMDNIEISSCLVAGTGGATGVFEQSALIDSKSILICCGDSVFCLAIPDLTLKWKINADEATCFKLYRHKEDFIVHGELNVTRINKLGEMLWQFSGADIFLSTDNGEECLLEEDGMLLTDFSGNRYKIDYSGRLLWTTLNA